MTWYGNSWNSNPQWWTSTEQMATVGAQAPNGGNEYQQYASQPWPCSFCEFPNTSKAKVCKQCGAKRAFAGKSTCSQHQTHQHGHNAQLPVQMPNQTSLGMHPVTRQLSQVAQVMHTLAQSSRNQAQQDTTASMGPNAPR